MFKSFMTVVLCIVTLMLGAFQAFAGRKVALIIGNSSYKAAPPLENPKNDAADISSAFKSLGFEVFEGVDLDKSAMERLIRDYAGSLSGAELGLFFYAGHGLQVNGVNYLVPIDAELLTAAALDFELVRLDLVQRTMERETPTNILFLDACRNNPLARNLARSLGTRSTDIGRGLAVVEAGQGTLISFSTQPGNVALDGTGRNSPFAGALVKHIAKPGFDLSNILIKVRTDVMETTQRSQVPWEHSSLTSQVYLSDRPATQDETAELALWEKVKDSLDPDVIADYTKSYPQGAFAVLARSLIEALRQQKEAVAKADEGETKRQRELQDAREQVKKAQEALKAAGAAKKAGVDISTLVPPMAKFDGSWRLIRLSEECKQKRIEFIVTIKDGVTKTQLGAGKTTSAGDFSLSGKGADGGNFSYDGKIGGTSGSGKMVFRRPERGFTCSGTFTMTKLD